MTNLENRTLSVINDIMDELARARSKFSSNDLITIAMAEEFGEVAKALLDEPWNNVRLEAIQLATMAIRLATEGDKSVMDFRKSRKLDNVDE